MIVRDLMSAMERIAPLELAEPWDNVGLLVGDPDASVVGAVVLTIDLTEAVLDEASGESAIIAYHPPIWQALKRVVTTDARQRIVHRAIASRLAVYSPHTALDAAPGGVTDWLCEILSGSETTGVIAGDCKALEPHEGASSMVKIVTFVPEESAQRVRDALSSAGAGRIGAYTQCSFASPGEGTFFGDEGASPVVGEAGRLERVHELRLEMVCPRQALAIALETLRQFHPYEEPAVDVYPLNGLPVRSSGAGRRLVLDQPATVGDLAHRLKAGLGASSVKLAPADGGGRVVTHVGVCPGSGGSLAGAAQREGCQVFITGEMKHHEVLSALDSGMSVILAGHTQTERGYLPRLAARLEGMLPGVRCVVSRRDAPPWASV